MENELYDEGGHVIPEVLADLIDESKGLTEDEAMEREHELEIEQMKDAEDKNLERLSDNFGNGGQY